MSYDPSLVRGSAVVKRDGTNDLTGDWDIGNQRKIILDELQMRDASGLTISDTTANILVSVDNQTGLFSLKEGSGINAFSTDNTLTENSDFVVPTQSAVKTYVDNSILDSTSISSLVEDTSPQLGGDLDSNGFDIEIASLTPSLFINKTNEAVDEGRWEIIAKSTGFEMRTVKDAPSTTGTVFFRAVRLGNGSQMSHVEFPLQIQHEWGSAGVPSYSFKTDADSGMYSGGSSILGFSTGNVNRLTIEANGTLNVAGTANYEALVTDDDDIPNKKYVDDNVGIQNVVEDLSPELGGDLDTLGYNIVQSVAGDLDIIGYPNAGGIGGTARIYAGTGSTTGGAAYLTAGAGVANGGATYIRGGSGAAGNGGDVYIEGGSGTGWGGSIRIRPGADTDGTDDGTVIIYGGVTNGADMRFLEGSANGTRHVDLNAPDDITTNRAWILPQDDPTVVAGYVLTTDSAGVLSFVEGLTVTDSTAIIFDGDIYCNDLFTSGDSIHVGTGEIKSTAGNVELYHAGALVATTQVHGLTIVGDAYSQINFYYNDSTNIGLAISSYTDDNAYFDLWAVEGAAFIFRGEAFTDIAKFIDGAGCELYHNGTKVLETATTGIQVTSTTNSNVAALKFNANQLRLTNTVEAGVLQLRGTQTGDSTVTMIQADPDGTVDIYHNNTISIQTRAGGIDLFDDAGKNMRMTFSGNNYRFINQEADGNILIKATQAGSSVVNMAIMDPDGAVELYYDGAKVVETIATGLQAGVAAFDIKTSGGEDGITINNNAGVELFYNNVKTLEVGSGVVTIYDFAASESAILFQEPIVDANFEIRNRQHGGSVKLSAENTATGAIKSLFVGSPDGAAELYHAGAKVSETTANGITGAVWG
jgi:hypothetical protein